LITGERKRSFVAPISVLGFAPGVRNIALVVVILANRASEAVSFSAVIDRVAPLRYLDRLGRREKQAP
jgi:hypothetical protein